jgi:hypothetical protein
MHPALCLQRIFGVKKKRVPPEIKHEWRRTFQVGDMKLSSKSRAYECPNCKEWTGNLALYKDEVCPAKDRRKDGSDRRES